MPARHPRYRDILRARRPSPIFSADPEHGAGSDTGGPDDQVAESATVTDIGSRRSSP
jgi:hypothetical protein